VTAGTTLQELVALPEDQRDVAWENRFFHALSMANLNVFAPEPKVGPDGWPYLLAMVEENSTEPFQRILQWIADKGIGLVINPEKEYPDYVFTYGMLWFFKETGLFYQTPQNAREGVFEFQIKDIKQAGEPAASYLPPYVRQVVKEFFVQQGVLLPKILAFSLDGTNFELAFSVESLGSPEQSEHQGILEAISWFLPPHYTVALVSEKELPIPFVAL
jgi:hypothetical protein